MPKLVMATACSRCENAKDRPMMRRSRSRNRVNGPGSRVAKEDAVNAARNSRNDVRAVSRIAARLRFGCIGIQGEGGQCERDQDHGDGYEQAPAVQEMLEAAMMRPRSRGG
jgi:hypothetical protein